MSLYRASDALMRHRDAIEDHLFGAIQSLFDVEQTVEQTVERTAIAEKFPPIF